MRRTLIRFGIGVAVVLLVCVITANRCSAQPKQADGLSSNKSATGKNAAVKSTVIEFELLQEPDGGSQFSQHWLRVLEPLDVKLRVHSPTLKDKPELKQREAAGIRYVTAVGMLERTGVIAFPNKKFEIGDTVKLRDWINELRTYGALGTPKGQPLWGLTNEQFEAVFAELIRPVDFETNELTLAGMVSKLPVTSKFPLVFSDQAKRRNEARGDQFKLRHNLKGFCTATALAIAVNESGMGFRPNRLPNGRIELLVEPRDPSVDQWAIGWPLQQQKLKSAPKFFEMIPIEVPDIELSDVINVIETISETPIFIDYAELDARHIDLQTTKVSFPKKVTNWSIALSRILSPQMLTHELWQDEAGHVFLWITTSKAARARAQERAKSEP